MKALVSDVGAGTGTRTPGLLMTSNLSPSAVLNSPSTSGTPTARERRAPSSQLSWPAPDAAIPGLVVVAADSSVSTRFVSVGRDRWPTRSKRRRRNQRLAAYPVNCGAATMAAAGNTLVTVIVALAPEASAL